MYLCYVTGEWQNVVPDQKISWDRHTQGITVLTDRGAGSDKYVILILVDEAGAEAGKVYIKFSDPITYQLSCQIALNDFSGDLPAAQEKTWIIEYKTAGLVIYCNEEKVLNVQLSDVCYDMMGWRTYWEREPTYIKFSYSDDATDSYCFNTGKYNGGFQEA